MDRVKALHLPSEELVEVIQDGEDRALVRFASGTTIWVDCDVLDFNNLDDDWGPENNDCWGRDSPTDFDEHMMNEDDCAPDAGDPHDIEYDR